MNKGVMMLILTSKKNEQLPLLLVSKCAVFGYLLGFEK